MRLSRPTPDPNRGVPAWTGLMFGLIALVSYCQPALVQGERSYSFYEMYCDMGVKPLACAVLTAIVLAMICCLLGLRFGAVVLSAALLEFLVATLCALCYSMGMTGLLLIGTLSIPGCLLGCAGLLANVWFLPLDRRIFGALLACWEQLDP